jgi:hypothetical protein
MPEDEFTQIRVPKTQRDQLKIRSIRNHRSIPKEIEYLIETVEAMEQTGIQKVEVLPGPKGSQRVPVVYVSQEPA